MIYLTLFLALFGNMDLNASDLNQTWIKTDSSSKGWHYSSKAIDIIRFSEDSILEAISVEQGVIKHMNFRLNEEKDIMISADDSFGRIISLDKNKLVIQYGDDSTSMTETYTLLPKTEVVISKLDVLETIKKHSWNAMVNRPGKMDQMEMKLGKQEGEAEADLQLVIGSGKQKVVMPANLKKVDECWFLSCQIPDIMGVSGEDFIGTECFIITKITEEEIFISFGADKKMGVHSFKKN